VVDHHVDRPEVEAEQSAQLTGTNRSIGLSVRIQRQESQLGEGSNPRRRHTQLASDLQQGEGLHGLVAIARGKTPDPIPNSAVKTLSADGTAS
jgi:hypothetical protein